MWWTKLEGLAAAQKENELEDFDRGPDEAVTWAG